MSAYNTDLYQRIHAHLNAVGIIDCHEHLQRERELPQGDGVHIGRFFAHYASADLISAGMPTADMTKVTEDKTLTPKERWALLAPWYRKSWNTAYCESLRIAWRDLYGIEDLTEDTVDLLTERMQAQIRPSFTRQVFDKAGIDYAMNHPLYGPLSVFNPDYEFDNFIIDIFDWAFTNFAFGGLSAHSKMEIKSLDDYLQVIDWYFATYGAVAGAFKTSRAYDRILYFEDVPRSAIEGSFNRLLAYNDRPDRKDIQALEDYIMHYLCRKCGEYGLRMKFHTGLQEGNGNIITNSRAALLANLFMKYPNTQFDLFHISYPYQGEAITLVKNFANVTMDFAWMWVINPAAGRRALSEMLDTLPANKIHGFGGDYIFVEGAYGHAVVAKREIARVLCEKVEEGRFSEEYACEVGTMLLRDNAIENFGLEARREAYRAIAGEKQVAAAV